jgi:hypothetical protein
MDGPREIQLKRITTLLDSKVKGTRKRFHSEALSTHGCLETHDVPVCWACFCERLANRTGALPLLRSLRTRQSLRRRRRHRRHQRSSWSCLILETRCKQISTHIMSQSHLDFNSHISIICRTQTRKDRPKHRMQPPYKPIT